MADERLTITTAIIGLIAVGGRTTERLWDLSLPSTKHSPALAHALQEVKQCRSTVHVLYKTLCLLEAGRLPLADRAARIAVEDLVATLTDTVLAFSDLHAVCDDLERARHAVATPEAAAWYAQRVAALCSRIRWQSLSMNLMMTILKCPGHEDAANASVGLGRRMTRILTSNTALSRRMRLLHGDAAVAAARSAPPHYVHPAGGPASPRPAPAPSDSAAPAPPHGRPSPYSGYTLADVPVMSIVSLPVTTAELRDGPVVYTAVYARRMGRHLGELVRAADGQDASKTIEAIRRSNVDADADGPDTAKKSRFYRIRMRRRTQA